MGQALDGGSVVVVGQMLIVTTICDSVIILCFVVCYFTSILALLELLETLILVINSKR